MEPASSSDDDSSVDEQESKLPSSFNDLPSDDSCLDSDSDSDADSDADSDSESDSEKPDEYEDMTLEERIHAKQNQGIRRNPYAASKKSKALTIAQKRLSDMKRKRSNQNGIDSNTTSSSKHKDDEEGTTTSGSIKKKSKKSRNAPSSASSKRGAFFSRGAPDLNSSGIGVEIGANRYKPRDPRHQSLSGHFDQTVFEHRYEFLEKVQDEEIETAKQRCKAWKIQGKKGQRMRKKLGLTSGDANAEEDQVELTRLMQERASRSGAKIRTAAKRSVKKKLRDEVASGKRGAYYLKKRDMKKMELEAKFQELKRIGGNKKVNEVIAKRRKKKMSKDSSLMPNAV